MTPSIPRRCCVCGYLLPDMTIPEMRVKGMITEGPDGQLLYHCIGRHTGQDIRASREGVPRFRTGREV